MNLPKNSKDLSGQRFDRLVAIKPISTKRGVRKNGKPYSLGVVWECECDCGNPAEVLATHLINGETKSCGCLATDIAKENFLKNRKPPEDLSGNKYGFLTVVSMDSVRRGHNVYWWCQCDCGGELKSICASHLKSGKITSCGCKTSELISNARKSSPHEIKKDDESLYFVSKGHKIRFDEDDIDIATACLWNIDSFGYCAGTYNGEHIRLHRAIMGKYHNIYGLEIDHRSGNVDDYRKSNLRLATHAENMKNTNARPKGNRMHKGVSETRHGTRQADITCDGQRMYIGTYKTFEEACAARERQELELFGEFSRLHCITQNEEG